MLNKILPWFIYFGFLVAIVVTGWEEPLKYRFMSPEKIPVQVPVPQYSSAQSSIVPAATPQWMGDTRRWDTVRKATPVFVPKRVEP